MKFGGDKSRHSTEKLVRVTYLTFLLKKWKRAKVFGVVFEPN